MDKHIKIQNKTDSTPGQGPKWTFMLHSLIPNPDAPEASQRWHELHSQPSFACSQRFTDQVVQPTRHLAVTVISSY